MPELLGYINNFPTTGEYLTALMLELPPFVSRVMVHIKEEDVASIRWKILASMDMVVNHWDTIRDEEVLAKNGSDWETLTDLWRFLDIQVVSNEEEEGNGMEPIPASVTIFVSGA